MASPQKSTREIERKFLLRALPDKIDNFPHAEIEQGYLVSLDDGLQVRLRKTGNRHSLTFKQGNGRTREEREIELSAEQFAALWPATAGKRLRKVRYEVPWQNYKIEIDFYRDNHDGLIVAEVEFADEKSCASFQPPAWFGDDVTGDPRYSNQLLAS